ncbi:hypothetical protein SAMN05428985_11068 [Nocardioides sp. YR527]|uniref:hypothetical protein n=1 Tax=Nocardioides sp. YR527 TaxID=1881028 RepID=UPI0008904957|nr:hypothetical protein [Nocardioides sp. YR527]SDL15029.1 hypothetical protein SAMN05428985_11068 [Nocardioides sp. YR527]
MSEVFTLGDTLPNLYIPYPSCGHCFNDVTIEDGYAYCETCRIQWPDISEDATASPDENVEGTEVPCEIVHDQQKAPYDHDGKRWEFGPPQPCILPSGHEGPGLCPVEATITPFEEVATHG